MKNLIQIYVCAYGNQNKEDKGIVQLLWDKSNHLLTKKHIIHLVGKTNMFVQDEHCFYLSEQRADGNFLKCYDQTSLELIYEVPTDYFYSYANLVENRLYLASYASGVDSLFDTKEKCFVQHVLHPQKDSFKPKSHFIHATNDGVIGIENGCSELYFYDQHLNTLDIQSFEPIGPRLMSFDSTMTKCFINTEQTNELLVMDLVQKTVIQRIKMSNQEKSYNGGNACTLDGKYVAVSVRSFIGDDDELFLYENHPTKNLILVDRLIPGKMPRDLLFVDDFLFVSCTDDNKVEAYQIQDSKLIKVNEISVAQPITFQM